VEQPDFSPEELNDLAAAWKDIAAKAPEAPPPTPGNQDKAP
jgi:hypothetical protein